MATLQTNPSGNLTPPPAGPVTTFGDSPGFSRHTLMLDTALGEARALRPGADILPPPRARASGATALEAEPLPERGWLLRIRGPIDLKADDVLILKQPGGLPALTAVLSEALSFPRQSSRTLLLSAPSAMPSDDLRLQPVLLKNSALPTVGAGLEGAAKLSSDTVRIALPEASHTVKIPVLPRGLPTIAPIPAPAPVPHTIQSPRQTAPQEPVAAAPWYDRITPTQALAAGAAVAVWMVSAASKLAIDTSAAAAAEATLAGLAGLALAGWAGRGILKRHESTPAHR